MLAHVGQAAAAGYHSAEVMASQLMLDCRDNRAYIVAWRGVLVDTSLARRQRSIETGTNQARLMGGYKMAKAERNGRSTPKQRHATAGKSQARGRLVAAKSQTHGPSNTVARASAEAPRAGWATDLVFDVREPKLAVSLRLDADVLRFFRGFGAGYQTRINEVLKAFMQAREGVEIGARVASAKASRAIGTSKRAR